MAELLFSPWMLIKPRPTTIDSLFQETILAPLTQWFIFGLLYVPQAIVSLVIGFFAGYALRSRTWLAIGVFVGSFTLFDALRAGGAPWWSALLYLQGGAINDFVFWSTLAAELFLSPLLGCKLGRWVRPIPHKLGTCHKCGYLLFGLPTSTCPECGNNVMSSE